MVPPCVLGQSRQFSDVRGTSALPLLADIRCEDRQVRFVPLTDSLAQSQQEFARADRG